MKRGDGTVITVSAVLAVGVVAAVTYSQFVLDREPTPTVRSAESTSSLLVMTWGPTLCTVEHTNPGCSSGHVEAMGTALVLHGLWPQPRSEELCGVSHTIAEEVRNVHSGSMPALAIPGELETKLESIMSDASVMAPHEWYTHGTCSGVDPTEYFTVAAQLADQASAALNPIFAQSQGNRLTPSTIRAAVDDSFGDGAGSRISLTCREIGGKGSAVYEVQLSLPPVATLRGTDAELSLGELIKRGPTINPGCQDGRIP